MTLRRYQNRAIEAAQVIEELIALARQMREAASRGEELGSQRQCGAGTGRRDA
jgi:type I restriction enzyme, R subunit